MPSRRRLSTGRKSSAFDHIHILRFSLHDIAEKIQVVTDHASGIVELPGPVLEVDFHTTTNDLLIPLLKNDVAFGNGTHLQIPELQGICLQLDVTELNVYIAPSNDVALFALLLILGLKDDGTLRLLLREAHSSRSRHYKHKETHLFQYVATCQASL